MAERDRGYALHREAQRRAWLALSHRDRLAWLEEAKAFAVRALAAAARRRGSRERERPGGAGSGR